jgi:hypothetical protein
VKKVNSIGIYKDLPFSNQEEFADIPRKELHSTMPVAYITQIRTYYLLPFGIPLERRYELRLRFNEST